MHSCYNIQFEHTLILQYTIWARTHATIYHWSTHSCCNIQFEHTVMLQYNIWAHTRDPIYNLSTHSCYNITFEHTLMLQYTIQAHTHAAIYHLSTHSCCNIATIWILSNPCATKDPVGTHLYYKNVLQLLPKLHLIIKNTSGKHLMSNFLCHIN